MLYIVDDSLFNKKPKDIPSNQMGTIKIWHDLYNIEIHILTTGACDVWEQGADVFSCKTINDNPDIHGSLQDFIGN
jgi:hypothetical protein